MRDQRGITHHVSGCTREFPKKTLNSCLLAGTLFRHRTQTSVKIPGMERITRTHVLAFILLCLLTAAALRLPNLSGITGLHYDEAANVILTGEISRGESHPIFIESYTGKEVLFFYFAAGLMRLIGESMFALRLTGSVCRHAYNCRNLLAGPRIGAVAAGGNDGSGIVGSELLASGV